MNVVLLSGGSGKRLWPLSNDTLSKQFLKLLKDDKGDYESMVQRVRRQLISVYPDVDFFISSNHFQQDIIRRQLGDVKCIFEPSRRNTFPAIALAAAHLHYNEDKSEDDVFIVCPIDVFADVKYFELLSGVVNLVSSGKFNIGLMGAKPEFPTEKYGYILHDDGIVRGFVEKPNEKKAAKLISEGALWNCGIFAVRIGYVLEKARAFVEFDSFNDLSDRFSDLPSISFDYEVVEKEPSIGTVVYEGLWKDLGTWNTLTEEMSDSSMGTDVLVSDSCSNTHVLNMLNIPIIAQDLHDIAVIASHDGILVTSKTGSSFVKPLTEKINLRPMYEQRRWGDYRVLEYKQGDERSSIVKRMRIDAGKAISYQYHNQRSEVWVVVSGKGILTIDGVDSVVGPQSVIHIPVGTKHSLLAATELEFIEVQIGDGDLSEDDNVRV